MTQRFTTPFTEHAFLEPECAVAFPYKNGVKVQSTDQGAYDTRKECAHMFGWDSEPERVVVETMLVGGGFGGKEDVSIQHLAALAAYKFQRPVKCKLTRAESLAFHPKRHAMDGTFTLGCDARATLPVWIARSTLIPAPTRRCAARCSSAPVRMPSAPTSTRTPTFAALATTPTNPPAGCVPRLGVCQSEFALESLIDLLADEVGLDSVGDPLP